MSFNNDISDLIKLAIEENKFVFSYNFDNSDEYKEIYNRVDNKSRIIDCMEEDLNCLLDVLFKAIQQGKIWWHEQWCKIFIVAIYEESTRPYIEVICKDYEYHRLVFIDDYKKSWWLREDKSE